MYTFIFHDNFWNYYWKIFFVVVQIFKFIFNDSFYKCFVEKKQFLQPVVRIYKFIFKPIFEKQFLSPAGRIYKFLLKNNFYKTPSKKYFLTAFGMWCYNHIFEVQNLLIKLKQMIERQLNDIGFVNIYDCYTFGQLNCMYFFVNIYSTKIASKKKHYKKSLKSGRSGPLAKRGLRRLVYIYGMVRI